MDVPSDIILLMTLIDTVSFSYTSIWGPGYWPLTRMEDLRLASGIAKGVWRWAGKEKYRRRKVRMEDLRLASGIAKRVWRWAGKEKYRRRKVYARSVQECLSLIGGRLSILLPFFPAFASVTVGRRKSTTHCSTTNSRLWCSA